MRVAYVDTSVFVAILFDEPGASRLQTRLRRFDRLVSSDLLVAELAATASREGVDAKDWRDAIAGVSLVIPDRTLAPEILRALEAGRLRGADLWHVACGLFVANGEPRTLRFLTLDHDQDRLARRLGFLGR